MRLKVVEAQRWTIVAICDDRGGCRVLDSLNQLERDSPRDFDQVVGELKRAALDGPLMSPKKSRPLGGKVYELKTRGGIRIPYFCDAGRLIVCTEAVRKPKPEEVRAVIARADAERERYFAAKRRSELVIIEEGQ